MKKVNHGFQACQSQVYKVCGSLSGAQEVPGRCRDRNKHRWKMSCSRFCVSQSDGGVWFSSYQETDTRLTLVVEG